VAAETANPAMRTALPLLTPEARARAERLPAEAPYLDLVEGEVPSTGPTQDLMSGERVPRIYERYWRPALGRVAKGFTGPSMSEEVRIARLLLGLSEGFTVLDLACGTGGFSRAFASTVGPAGLVVGVDASPTMLARAAAELRKRGPENVALIRADAESLPFDDSGFDAVCCFAALHLFADPMRALDEMTRVLTPGGRIAIMTSVRRQLAPGPFASAAERLSGMRLFRQDAIVGALQERGFEDVHQRLSGLVQFVGGRLRRPATQAG
jgi:ubiquinone/menaquinone biosynthesis C-methylase UbiE